MITDWQQPVLYVCGLCPDGWNEGQENSVWQEGRGAKLQEIAPWEVLVCPIDYFRGRTQGQPLGEDGISLALPGQSFDKTLYTGPGCLQRQPVCSQPVAPVQAPASMGRDMALLCG